MKIIGESYLIKLAADQASVPSIQPRSQTPTYTSSNPPPQINPKVTGSLATRISSIPQTIQAKKIDTQADDLRRKIWANEDPVNLGYDKNGNPLPAIRANTYAINGNPINIQGITPTQHAAIFDRFEATTRDGIKYKAPLPKVRPRQGNDNIAGTMNRFTNTMELSPNSGGWSPGFLTGHELTHWKDNNNPNDKQNWLNPFIDAVLYNSSYSHAKTKEMVADHGSLLFNNQVPVDTKITPFEQQFIQNRLNQGKSYPIRSDYRFD
jgi:hypothetical protein